MFGFLRRGPKYGKCPMCGSQKWLPRGRGEVVERFNGVFVRQYHVCTGCGVRFNLIRHVRSNEWCFTSYAAALRQ